MPTKDIRIWTRQKKDTGKLNHMRRYKKLQGDLYNSKYLVCITGAALNEMKVHESWHDTAKVSSNDKL